MDVRCGSTQKNIHGCKHFLYPRETKENAPLSLSPFLFPLFDDDALSKQMQIDFLGRKATKISFSRGSPLRSPPQSFARHPSGWIGNS